MRTGIHIEVTAEDTKRLEAIVAARGSAQKHVWRSQITLATAKGLGMQAIMAATGKSKPCVWRWQERFMAEVVDGLLRDKSRPPGIAPLDKAVLRGVQLRQALRRIGKWAVEIVKRSDAAKGFVVLPRRWVVERTLAWLNRNRSLAKGFEQTIASATARPFIASIRLFVNRIARL